MALKFAITNLAGDQVAVPQQYDSALVTIPYNDSRTAELIVSADDVQTGTHALVLERMLKAWYIWPDGTAHLVFWGPITTATWTLTSGSKSTLKINAHDMSLRLKHAYLEPSDTSVFTGTADDPGVVEISAAGLRLLRDLAQTSGSVPDIGIGDGTDTSSSSSRITHVQKGDEIWQTWRDISDDPGGPDFRLSPDDSTPGQYALLDTLNKAETEGGGTRDKRLDVIFQAGFGVDNVETFTYAPAGEKVRNRAVAVQAHSDQTSSDKVAVHTNPTSQDRFGEYTDYEAAGVNDNAGVDSALDGKAKSVLLAYSYPPQDFSFTPRNDERQRYIYGRDFEEADVISCAAHFGGLRIWLPGFVTEVRLRQKAASGLTQTEIDAIPEADASSEIV